MVAGVAVTGSASKLTAMLRISAWAPTAVALGGSLAMTAVSKPSRFGSETGQPSFSAFWALTIDANSTVWLGYFLATAMAALLVQPLQSGLIGFATTQSSKSTFPKIKNRLERRHVKNFERLMKIAVGPSALELAQGATVADKQTRATASRKLQRYPKKVDQIRPTLLGNVLARAELSAGCHFGFKYQLLGPALLETFDKDTPDPTERSRMEIELQAGLALSFVLVAAVSSWGFWGTGWRFTLVPLAWMGLAVLAYWGAVKAGSSYHAAIDLTVSLHRFRLLEALRIPLPTRVEDEVAAFDKAAELLDPLIEPMAITYVHGPKASKAEPETKQPGRHFPGEVGT